MLDFSEDEVLKEEGLAREVINRIQKLRKTVSHHRVTFRNLDFLSFFDFPCLLSS